MARPGSTGYPFLVQRGKGGTCKTMLPAAVDVARKVPLPSEIPARRIEAERPLQKQIDDGARSMRLFIDLHGDLPVDKTTGACIAQLAAWAEANAGKRKLSRRTISAKAVGTISTLLGQALLDGHVRSTVAFGRKLKIKPGDRQERRPCKAAE